MTLRSFERLLRGAFLCLLASTWTAATGFTDENPHTKPVGEQAVGEAEGPAVTAVPRPGGTRLDAGQLVPRTIPVDPLHHRGGIYTDAGEGRPNVLNEIELAKLAAARAAIEASRAAGTLWVLDLPEDVVPATSEDVDAMKRQKLRAQEPLPAGHDPAAGVGEWEGELPPLPVTPEVIEGDHSPTVESSPVPVETAPSEEVPTHD